MAQLYSTCLPVQEIQGDVGLIPASGRSLGVGNSNPLQYSCLENHIDRGAWQAAVHGSQRVRHDCSCAHTHTHTHTHTHVTLQCFVSFLL